MDTRSINHEYSDIVNELINSEPELQYIAESDAQIICLSSQHEKKSNGKSVLGQCEKIQDKYKWSIPCDFTITVFEPNVTDLTDEQIRIVLFHELLHVGIKQEGEKETYFIQPHDLEDFKLIIDKFGTDWNMPQ